MMTLKRTRSDALLPPPWDCSCGNPNPDSYNYCGMCGVARGRSDSSKRAKLSFDTEGEVGGILDSKDSEVRKKHEKCTIKQQKAPEIIQPGAAKTGYGLAFHLPDKSLVMTSEVLSYYQLQMMSMNWHEKKTRGGHVRQFVSWGYMPFGMVSVADITPRGLLPLRPLIGALFVQARDHAGGDICPMQVYINLYPDGSSSCPGHTHSCRQLTLSIGATRSLRIKGKDFKQKHGDVVVLHGQNHAVPKDEDVKEPRISVNLFYTLKSEAATASVNSWRRRAPKKGPKANSKNGSNKNGANNNGANKNRANKKKKGGDVLKPTPKPSNRKRSEPEKDVQSKTKQTPSSKNTDALAVIFGFSGGHTGSKAGGKADAGGMGERKNEVEMDKENEAKRERRGEA
ncbi:hypothetical protein AAMO2058_000181200 [Amorphochlora amoebiformis]